MATVTLDDLTKEYGELTAVNGLDLEVQDGELLCLLGPSGCGKSTTLRMLGGLETPTSGDVYIDDDRVTDQPPYTRDTAMVFQSWALFPSKTVLENVEFGLKMAGMDADEREAKARRVLDIVEMGEFAEADPTGLSGGQKQRVALARSLAIEPEVLLLDEPLSNLDKRLREQLQLELADIHDEVDTTFVYVTHDQNEAFTLADRIGILNDGEVEQIGEPREVYSDPESLFIEEFLGDTNLVDAEAVEVTDESVVADTEFGVEVELPIRDGLSAGDPLTISFRPEELDVERVETDGGMDEDDAIEAEVTATDGGTDVATESADEEPFTTALTGEITDILYRGSSVRFYAQIGERDVFFEQSVAGNTDFETGDTVRVSWDPSDLLLFSEGDRIGGGEAG
ncbi:ABC transporter ATP-binding protein [Haloparvum sp. PAK95]|uniref:ABC transporter ATP-binding protein n=1 Tax=Haloparvum sp. PAK95 TaxID=3418962 RepID=UPI003D2EF330